MPASQRLLRREDARFLYKRTPAAVRDGNPGIEGAFQLLQGLWTLDFASAWTALQRRWERDIEQALAHGIEVKLHERTWSMVEQTYTSIQPKFLGRLVCASADAVLDGRKDNRGYLAPTSQCCCCTDCATWSSHVAEALSRGWELTGARTGSGVILTPPQRGSKAEMETTVGHPAISAFSQYVLQLESVE